MRQRLPACPPCTSRRTAGLVKPPRTRPGTLPAVSASYDGTMLLTHSGQKDAMLVWRPLRSRTRCRSGLPSSQKPIFPLVVGVSAPGPAEETHYAELPREFVKRHLVSKLRIALLDLNGTGVCHTVDWPTTLL
jgi:hypothetical protein